MPEMHPWPLPLQEAEAYTFPARLGAGFRSPAENSPTSRFVRHLSSLSAPRTARSPWGPVALRAAPGFLLRVPRTPPAAFRIAARRPPESRAACPTELEMLRSQTFPV